MTSVHVRNRRTELRYVIAVRMSLQEGVARARNGLDDAEAHRGRSCVTAIGHVELAQQAGDVTLHRTRAEEELLGDLGIGQALTQQGEDIPLTRTEGDTYRCEGRGAWGGRRSQVRQHCLRLSHGLLIPQCLARRPARFESGIAQ